MHAINQFSDKNFGSKSSFVKLAPEEDPSLYLDRPPQLVPSKEKTAPKQLDFHQFVMSFQQNPFAQELQTALLSISMEQFQTLQGRISQVDIF